LSRTIQIAFGGEVSSFDFTKVDRGKLYGRKTRVCLDAAGRECAEARLTEDGCHILPNGTTASLYINERGDAVSSKMLVALDSDGQPLPLLPSTLDAPQDVSEPVPLDDILAHKVTAVYQLDDAAISPALESALSRGDIFRVPFRYRPSCHDNPAFLLKNDEGTFLLVAEPAAFDFLGYDAVATEPVDDEMYNDAPDDFEFGIF
jgi:hypothetical protein